MRRLLGVALTLALVAGPAFTQDKVVNFGSLDAMSVEAARAQAQAWLKDIGKTDSATMERFEAIWKQADVTVLDRVTETITMADPAAAKLLADARDTAVPAPTKVPDILKDNASAFYKANLGLAYARTLSNRRVHEEGLEVLRTIKAEQVVDPSAYLFHRAIAEHALLNKAEATKTIVRLLEEAATAPERYKTVSALMLLDMQAWKDKDLGAVARKMENIERRLELARGGPQTQKLQREVIARLDELIKELENKTKKKAGGGGGDCPNGGSCPDGQEPGSGSGPPKGNNPSSPATESGIANIGGSGRVDGIKLKKLQENWGRMPPRDRDAAIQDLTRGLPARHREAIENYFRNLAQASANNR